MLSAGMSEKTFMLCFSGILRTMRRLEISGLDLSNLVIDPDEAEYQRNFAEMEEAPADIESVGFKDGINQRTNGGKQPAAQSQADGGGEDALPHGLIEERAADKRCGCAEQLGDFDFFFAAEDLQTDGVMRDKDERHAQRQ